MAETYIPLYSKYRPQTLDMLVGQEHIKKTLTSAIELGKISHAYLFTGPRGTGKTSTARILAKSLNCIKGPTVHPCGECESCKNIINSVPIDVIEIDAASNRSVEDAQNLLEKIQYIPINGKYKIYIIDEIHMLSSHAFNALLKTLEEPPQNVIFILATTEVHKVLDTIKSRCQRYDFKRITTSDIVKHLKYISDKEQINITDDALLAIAQNSAGGMRDSISLLDQLSILSYSKKIDTDDVNVLLGRISFDILSELSESILSSSTSGSIKLLNDIYNSGNEPLQILTNLSEYFKNLLITKTCSKEMIPELTGLNELQINKMLEQAKNLETQQIVFLVERISYYIQEMKSVVNQYLWLEVGIIDLSNMTENSKLIDLQNRISALENGNIDVRVKSVIQTIPAKNYATQAQNPEEHVKKELNIHKMEDTNNQIVSHDNSVKNTDKNDTVGNWQNLLANIDNTPVQALLKQLATPVSVTDKEIVIAFKTDIHVTQMNTPNKKACIQLAAEKLFGNSDILITIKKLNQDETAVMQNAVTDKKKINNSEIEAKKQSEIPLTEIETDDNQHSIKDEPTLKQTNKNIDIKTDQEKMILDLFDGKYIE